MPPEDDDGGVLAEALRRVERDIVEGKLKDMFTASTNDAFAIGLHGSEDLNNARAIARSDELIVVPWSYACTHTGYFMGVQPTYVNLDLRGTTFVDIRGAAGDWQYHRYIDYTGALHQIGVSTNGRPVLTDEQYQVWREQSTSAG